MNKNSRRLLRSLWNHKIKLMGFISIGTIASFKIWSNRKFLKRRDTPTMQYWIKESKEPISIENIPNRTGQIFDLQRHCISSNNQYKKYRIPSDYQTEHRLLHYIINNKNNLFLNIHNHN